MGEGHVLTWIARMLGCVCLVIGVLLTVLLFWPTRVGDCYYVMHDHGVTMKTAGLLRVIVPLVACGLSALALFVAPRRTRSGRCSDDRQQ
jgi:hypothetical protein